MQINDRTDMPQAQQIRRGRDMLQLREILTQAFRREANGSTKCHSLEQPVNFMANGLT
jgi:hypothetical protein